MRGYISTLLIISVVGGIVSSLCSSISSLKKYINYFVGLIAIICMLSPLASFLSNIGSTKDFIKEYFDSFASEEIINSTNDIIINSGIDSIKSGIENTLIQKFGFNESDIIVELDIDKSNIEAIKIKKINIILTGKASWSDVDRVKSYLESIIGGNISVKRS